MKLSRERLIELLGLLELTQQQELDCDGFLERLPRYLEQRIEQGDCGALRDAHLELLQHLRVCPECLEEFEALVRSQSSCDDDE